MKTKAEFLQKINEQRKVVMNLLTDGKLEEAKLASEKLEDLMSKAEMAAEVPQKGQGSKMVNAVNLKTAVNAFLHKGWKGMNDEEKTFFKASNATEGTGQVETVANRGGVLVPVETADFVGRMETGIYRLRTRVSEYFSKSLSGKIPLLANPTAGLVAQFDELPTGGIQKGDVKFGSVDWAVRDYGLIVPVSNDLMEDAEADVYGVIAEQFARAQVITENLMILAAIDANGAATAVNGWADISKALNETAPIGSVDKVIVTNTDGYNYLDTLVDETGRPILTQALVDNPKRIFRGYEVIQLPNEILATTSGVVPFYVGSLRDAVYFIERRGLTISYNPYSDSAYSKNAVDVRVTCRMDCKTKFATAVKKLALELS